LSGAIEQFLIIRRAVIAVHATDSTGKTYDYDPKLASHLSFLFHEPGATDQLLNIADLQNLLPERPETGRNVPVTITFWSWAQRLQGARVSNRKYFRMACDCISLSSL